VALEEVQDRGLVSPEAWDLEQVLGVSVNPQLNLKINGNQLNT
jgi:hypothetical protein